MTTTKNILIYSERPDSTWSYVSWFLHDPLIVSEARITTELRTAPHDGAHSCPDLSRHAMSAQDLVLVPYPHLIRATHLEHLLEYLDRGGALLLVQPTFETPDLARSISERAGFHVAGSGQDASYYSFSIVGDHPAARILGLPVGTSIYPHTKHAPHAVFDVAAGAVLSRTSSGDPDLFVCPTARVAIASTDVFTELERHEKSGPDYYVYRNNISLLMINAVRHLLGSEFVVQPVQRPQQRWSDLFSAFAAGKDYVSSAQRSMPDRLPQDELVSRLERADHLVGHAAAALQHGRIEDARQCYDAAVEVLAQCMDDMTNVDRYIIRGWQANGLFDHDYGGGLLGFAQTQWMDLLLRWMTLQLDWVKRTGARRIHDISSMTWEVMARHYGADLDAIKDATKEGILEAVSGLYTKAYLPLLSAESNVRQFHFGHQALRAALDIGVEAFLEPRDHFNFHPQLPQLLAGFGYRAAVIRCLDHLGEITPVRAEKIRWRGMDGTEIEAVPTYDGLPTPYHPHLWFDPAFVAKADQLGYRHLLLGDSFDSTLDFAGEKEHTILNGIAPVLGTWTTVTEYFRSTPPAEQSFFFGVDDLYARYMEVWSSFGCLNEAYAANRSTEALILAAEKFSAVAAVVGNASSEQVSMVESGLRDSWKNLLATQDRMAFGAVNYDAQVPEFAVDPLDSQTARHYWGFQLDPQPQIEKFNTMGMENLQEMLTENYAGPMVPVSRYQRVADSLERSRSTADGILEASLRQIATSIDTQGVRTDGIPVVVFNQLGWPCVDVVTVDKEFPPGTLFDVQLTDGHAVVPHQVLSSTSHPDGSIDAVRFLFLADVPSMGYKTFFLVGASGRSV